MTIEQKGVQGKEKEQFRDMLPPDGHEMDWQKQFKLMNRHTTARARAEQVAIFAAGFALAGFINGRYGEKVAAIVGLAILVAWYVAVAIKTDMTARAIDKKLDEDVRIEKEAAAGEAKA